jgi:hypothetical protein
LIREEDEPLMSREEFNELLEQLKDTDLEALTDELDKEVENLIGTLPRLQRFSRSLSRVKQRLHRVWQRLSAILQFLATPPLPPVR